MRLLLVMTLIAGCFGSGDQVPGAGPTCKGAARECTDLFVRLPLIRDAFNPHYPDVSPILDYTVVSGAFEHGGQLLCGLNEKVISGNGPRCKQTLGCVGTTTQSHEYLHCALAFMNLLDGDAGHTMCPLWGLRWCGERGLLDDVVDQVNVQTH